MKKLYVVTSPMQLINAYEYKMQDEQKENQHHLKIFYHLSKRKTVFEECLKLMNWDKVSFSFSFQNIGLNGGAMVIGNFLIEKINQFFTPSNSYSEIIVGHYMTFVQRGFLKGFNGRITIVDDGNFSFHVAKYRKSELEGEDVLSNEKFDKANQLTKDWFWTSLKNKPVQFFSTYPIEIVQDDSYVFNAYKSWKKVVESRNQSITDEIWIIGGDYSENGWMTAKTYVDTLQKYMAQHPNVRFKYIKKWSEDLSKLEAMIDQIEVVSFKLPLEVELLNAKKLPKNVIGFISSVLFNMSPLLNEKVSFDMPLIDMSLLSEDAQQYFEDIYQKSNQFPINTIKN